MGKKKEVSNSSFGKPQNSFKEMVSDASLARLKPFIQDLFSEYKQEQIESFQGLYERLTALEKLVLEKTNTSNEEYVDRVTDVQDSFYGLIQAGDQAALGDVVRIEVSTKTKDQAEYQGTSRMMIQALGSGKAIGAELESKLVGLSKGETREFEFGVEGAMMAKITLNRISRRA